MSEVTAPEFKPEIREVEIDGYKFQVNTDFVDDVEIVDMIDEIENKKNLKAIVEFLKYLIGDAGYENIKSFYVKKDGRFRLTKLTEVYQAIFENLDPKDLPSSESEKTIQTS